MGNTLKQVILFKWNICINLWTSQIGLQYNGFSFYFGWNKIFCELVRTIFGDLSSF